jgi:methanogenic corrinoid protein MtbC1
MLISSEELIEFESALLLCDSEKAMRQFSNLAQSGDVIGMIESIIVPVLEKIGMGWEQGDIALSQIYMSGRICEEIIETYLPAAAPERISTPPMAIAVLNDYHLLGKRIVYSSLRASGFDLLDYGQIDVDDLVKKVEDDQIQILLISTLMLPAALQVADVIENLSRRGFHPSIIVGGAPFNFDSQLWKEVGADAMGENSSSAIRIIRNLMKEHA